MERIQSSIQYQNETLRERVGHAVRQWPAVAIGFGALLSVVWSGTLIWFVCLGLASLTSLMG